MFMLQGQTSAPHLMCVSCIYVYLWMFALASCFHSPPCLINISFSLTFNCKFEHMLWLKEKSKTTKRDIFVSYWGCPPHHHNLNDVQLWLISFLEYQATTTCQGVGASEGQETDCPH